MNGYLTMRNYSVGDYLTPNVYASPLKNYKAFRADVAWNFVCFVAEAIQLRVALQNVFRRKHVYYNNCSTKIEDKTIFPCGISKHFKYCRQAGKRYPKESFSGSGQGRKHEAVAHFAFGIYSLRN